MGEIATMLESAAVPDFFKVEYELCSDEVGDAASAVREALERENTLSRIRPGSSVALTAGSREIRDIDLILRTLAEELKAAGASPFIIPAMGSHGGATAEGQKALIEGYGITEQRMEVPIISSMETVEVGKTAEGLPVHVDRAAHDADFIIPVGRVKPHPEFRGRHESGLLKMLAIGLGKQHGANMCHQLGMDKMPDNILKFAEIQLAECSIPFGIGIVENGSHGTWHIRAIPAEVMVEEDAELLVKAKELVPVIPFRKTDVIICEEMGKDISGTGMDSNVIGRSISMGISRPFAERIGIFRLTGKSHGNFNGVGLGDSISRKLFDSMSFDETYPNTITACEPFAVKIPPVMENDRLCLEFCIQTCLGSDRERTRIVWIRNTLSLDSFYISEALVGEASADPLISVDPEPCRPEFNDTGTFIGFVKK